MSAEIPAGYRKATAEEVREAFLAGRTRCIACAQPKRKGSNWIADRSSVDLCALRGENDCIAFGGFFVRTSEPTR